MALAASKPNTGWTVILLPLAWLKKDYINTSYLTDSYIGFTLKIESVSKNTFFGLKMMVKSGLEKKSFEIPPCEGLLFLLHNKSAQNHKFSNKNNYISSRIEEFQNTFFYTTFHHHF